MSVQNVIIREARTEDCENIIKLTQELADFEKMPNGPKLNAEILRKDGFGEEKMFRCFVAEDTKLESTNNLVGHALYFFSYSTWEGVSVYLEDLYVTPSHRHRGIGMLLWRKVGNVAIQRNCKRMDWVCLDWNKEAVELYKANGARNLSENEGWHLFRLSGQQLKAFVKGKETKTEVNGK